MFLFLFKINQFAFFLLDLIRDVRAGSSSDAQPNWNNIVDGFGEITNSLGRVRHGLGRIVPDLAKFEVVGNAVRPISSHFNTDLHGWRVAQSIPPPYRPRNPENQQSVEFDPKYAG